MLNFQLLLSVLTRESFLKDQDVPWKCGQKERPLSSHRKGPFKKCTDTSIYRVSIPLSLMCFTSSISKPLLVPSLSMQLRSISPAPSFPHVCASCKASTSLPSLPPFTVHWYQQILECKKETWLFLIRYLLFLSAILHWPNHVPTAEGKQRKFYSI